MSVEFAVRCYFAFSQVVQLRKINTIVPVELRRLVFNIFADLHQF